MAKDQITADMLTGITLKDFQLEGLLIPHTSEVGIFDVAVGGGKGELIAGLCKVVNCFTVVLTEQVIIVDQLQRRLQLRDVCAEPGKFYAGKRPNGEMVVIGTIQSLNIPKKPEKPEQRTYSKPGDFEKAWAKYEMKTAQWKVRNKNARELYEHLKTAEMLLVDEADKAVSETWKDLFRYRFKGRFRYGFTGTVDDPEKPVESLILREHLGSPIFRQDQSEVEAEGLTVPLTYYMLAFGESGSKKEASAYDIAVNDNLVYNEEVHRLISKVCDRYPDYGKLILVERDDLGHALNELIPNSQYFHGKTPKSQRRGVLDRFESRERNVLIGGKNVRRGLDLKGGAEVLFLATGGKLASELTQQLGRARRQNKLGKSLVFDIFFMNNKYLYAHSRQRLKAVVDMGVPCFVVFKDGVVDGAKFVKSRFRKPKFIAK